MNKKGFTLAELLGTIVIISIIALILTTTVSMVLNSSKKNACKTQESTLIEAAKMYLTDNPTKNAPGNKVYIVSNLQAEGYLNNDIVNPVNKEKYNNETYVAISETENGLQYKVKYKGADASTCTGEEYFDINNLTKPTFTDTDISSGIRVTITYPNECTNANYTCTYQKDDETEVKVTTKTRTVDFATSGTLVAKVKYKDEIISASHTVLFLPMLKVWYSNANTDFHSDTYKTNITSIDVVDLNTTPAPGAVNNTTIWDVSSRGNGSVIAWVVNDPNNTGKYKLYIGGENKVYANSNSAYLFYGFSGLKTADLKLLDTSKATTMSYMFASTSGSFSYNQDYMELTSLDLSTWDTSKVTNMSNMFRLCTKLENINVSNFDTSKVTSMNGMFMACKKLNNIDVSKWDTSQLTNAGWFFYYCISLTSLDVSKWNTSKVTSMNELFSNCSSLTNLDVSKWNVSSVTDMSYLFDNCTSLTSIDVSKWNVSSVTGLGYTFGHCSKLTTIDVSKWNTSKVTSLHGTFADCSELTTLDVSKWDTSSVTNMYWTFGDCRKLATLDVSKWNTSSATYMYITFYNCSKLTVLDLSNWDTSKVTSMNGMFTGCSSLTTIYASDKFVTTSITDTGSMFYGCTSLKGGNGTTYDSSHTNQEYARIDKAGQKGYFTKKS